ncbi:MAG: DUF2231 domain-containing protein [Ilumatobacter sp.]|uniref:DUF2231 domain-containing protein n=1 Tax=Ilumatobacter sp. TaxID=1967498 RepID=UPI003C741F01
MIAGVFDDFFGVPTHPLAVHAPVVLIPLLAVVSVVVLFRRSWREWSTIPLAGLALVMVAMLFVAKESGESLKGSETALFGTQEMLDRHQDLGTQSFVLAIVWFVVAAAAATVSIVRHRDSVQSLSAGAGTAVSDPVVLALNVLGAVLVVVTTIWLIRTGHAGAEMRWPT